MITNIKNFVHIVSSPNHSNSLINIQVQACASKCMHFQFQPLCAQNHVCVRVSDCVQMKMRRATLRKRMTRTGMTREWQKMQGWALSFIHMPYSSMADVSYSCISSLLLEFFCFLVPQCVRYDLQLDLTLFYFSFLLVLFSCWHRNIIIDSSTLLFFCSIFALPSLSRIKIIIVPSGHTFFQRGGGAFTGIKVFLVQGWCQLVRHVHVFMPALHEYTTTTSSSTCSPIT